jgi:hypothetical protein
MIDFVEILSAITIYIQNERVTAYNEGVDAERTRCSKIASEYIRAACTGMKGRTDDDRQTAAARVTAQSIANRITTPDEG